MSRIFFRGVGGKTAKRKCFPIGAIILTSFPKHFGIHNSKVTSIFNNNKKNPFNLLTKLNVQQNFKT